jgi:FMN reductase
MWRPVIVGLGGTTREGSSTERAVVASLRAASALGAETVLLGANDLRLPVYAPESAARSEAAVHLVAQLRRADGVIVASPGYHGGISGLVKNALDYTEDMRDDVRPYLEGRAVGCIASAAGWQATTTTLVALRSVVHALRGWPTPLGVVLNSSEPAFTSGDADGTSAIEQQLERLVAQVVGFARAFATVGS